MSAELLEEHPSHRRAVVRKALLHTPGALVTLALLAWALAGLLAGNFGAVIGVIIIGIIAFALSFEALAALRDLRAEPVTTSGQIDRLWRKARILFFGRAHYVLIGRRVFEIDAITYADLEQGDDVEIVHWPHTNILVSLHRSGRERDAGGGEPRRSPLPPSLR